MACTKRLGSVRLCESIHQIEENNKRITEISREVLGRIVVGIQILIFGQPLQMCRLPFIANIHGHNDEKLTQLIARDPNGFPWPEALVT
jgi:hypothetical protein